MEEHHGWRVLRAFVDVVLARGQPVAEVHFEDVPTVMLVRGVPELPPEDVLDRHGADALRMYLMFLGPLDRDKPWKSSGIEGVRRFLDRVWRLYCDDETDELLPAVQDAEPSDDVLKILHTCIAEVTDRTENLLFNTAISSMMGSPEAAGRPGRRVKL